MVGIIEDLILGASWSPAQDRLVIYSSKPSLLLLSPEMDLLNEIPLNIDKFIPDSINISWRDDAKVIFY